ELRGPHWEALSARIGTRGMPSLDEALALLELEPVHAAFRALLEPTLVTTFVDAMRELPADRKTQNDNAWREPMLAHLRAFLVAARQFVQRRAPAPAAAPRDRKRADGIDTAVSAFLRRLEGLLKLATLESGFTTPWPAEAHAVLPAAD